MRHGLFSLHRPNPERVEADFAVLAEPSRRLSGVEDWVFVYDDVFLKSLFRVWHRIGLRSGAKKRSKTNGRD